MITQPENTQLATYEENILLDLLKKVGYRQTGTRIFEALWPIIPLACSEQVVVQYINNMPQVLMWYREDQHYQGWHMPGGYILHGENDWEWCERILKKEMDLELKKVEFIRRFNTRPSVVNSPCHQLAHLFLCTVEGKPSQGQFFPITDLPAKTIKRHRFYVDHIRAHLIRQETMRLGNIRYDGFNQALEDRWLVIGFDGLSCNYQAVGQYSLFDEAVKAAIANTIPPDGPDKGRTNWAFILDDQGHQIL